MKKLLLTTALVALVSPAFAAEKGPTVTLGGSLTTQLGYRQQKGDYRYDNLNSTSGNMLSKGGIVNDTKINVKVDGQAHGFKYGGLVSLNADTSANKYGNSNIGYQTMVYGEAKFGRLQAGSYTGAVDALSVGAANIAKATGGINGDAKYWWNQNIGQATLTNDQLADMFNVPAASFTDTTTFTQTVNSTFYVVPSLISNMGTGNTANASKVTYYTPKFSGFKAGLSYIPDTDQHGTIANLTSTTKKISSINVANGKFTLDNIYSYRDVFSGGVMFDHKMNDVTFKASLLGETGRAKDTSVTSTNAAGATTALGTEKRHDLRAWEVGASMGFKGFAVAASWGDLGKSGATKDAAGKAARSHYWTVGAAYDYSHFGASVTYMESRRGNADTSSKSSFKNLSVGMEYRVAPGFMPYAEVSAFKLDSKVAGSTKNNGNIFLAGTKLHF